MEKKRDGPRPSQSLKDRLLAQPDGSKAAKAMDRARQLAQEAIQTSVTALQRVKGALPAEGSPRRTVYLGAVLFLVTAGILLTLGAVLMSQSGTAEGPTEGFELYTIQPGDTLGNIAARYNTTALALADLNQISNPNLIRPGQVLKVPKASASP
ncbi:MAG: LysM peptidoglycan-binding domain-containing protein [Chloroflexi bacterium]|nr:LysM peptidoglycan-binding domain-containing protein [Chloroflexota bacterium]